MKKMMTVLAATTFLATATVGLCSFTSQTEKDVVNEIENHTDCQGKHCTYTVGCSCPGFSPITNGKEWQKAYCRHCGHPRGSHR